MRTSVEDGVSDDLKCQGMQKHDFAKLRKAPVQKPMSIRNLKPSKRETFIRSTLKRQDFGVRLHAPFPKDATAHEAQEGPAREAVEGTLGRGPHKAPSLALFIGHQRLPRQKRCFSFLQSKSHQAPFEALRSGSFVNQGLAMLDSGSLWMCGGGVGRGRTTKRPTKPTTRRVGLLEARIVEVYQVI